MADVNMTVLAGTVKALKVDGSYAVMTLETDQGRFRVEARGVKVAMVKGLKPGCKVIVTGALVSRWHPAKKSHEAMISLETLGLDSLTG